MYVRLFRIVAAVLASMLAGQRASAQVQFTNTNLSQELFATIPPDLFFDGSGHRAGNMTFAPNGDLYIGRSGSSSPFRYYLPEDQYPDLTILRIAAGETAPQPFGPPVTRPTDLAIDTTGLISGTPGTVLVGHYSSDEEDRDYVVSALVDDEAIELHRVDIDEAASWSFFYPLLQIEMAPDGELLLLL